MLTTREGGATASAPKHAEDDGEASNVGVNNLGDSGAAMRALRRSQPSEAEASGPAGAGLVLAAGARRQEVEEALRPLDGHRTVTGARIVHI